MAFVVFMLNKESQVQTFMFDKHIVNIGRSPDCEISLIEPSVSKLHGRISLIQQNLWIEDLGSANGILVNQTKIETKQAVTFEDHIEIRGFHLFMRPLSAEEQVQLIVNASYCPPLPSHLAEYPRVQIEASSSPAIMDPKSLDSIFEALTPLPDEIINQPHQLESIHEALTPEPDPNQPKSLNSIFNAVSPLTDQMFYRDSDEASSEPNSDSNDIPSTDSEASNDQDAFEPITAGQALDHSQSTNQPSSLNSVFNAVNPIPEELLKKQAEAESAPKSLNSVFNAVNPIPAEILAKDAPKDAPAEPKSLNSVFNAVNPIPEHILKAKIVDED